MSESAAPAAPPPVLGVRRSALGRAWIARGDAASEMIARAVAQTHGVRDVVARVLAARGVGVREAPGFLAPRLRDLMPDPSVLTDMERAAERLADAVERGDTVAVLGDYDVDGACSAALLAGFLAACGVPYLIHIPDRLTEGYGPNVEAVAALKARGADLLVTVDCGSTSHEPLAQAVRLGLRPIVLDHHQAPAFLPEAVIVNPNRQDDLSGYGNLCAAGVVFLTLVALRRELRRRGFFAARREPDLLADLDLVALATVADVVPLVGLNRAFVRHGLAVMRSRGRPGLAALCDAAGLNAAPEAWHLGFLLGPRINAGGRIGDAALGSRLLLSAETAEAARLAGELDRLNSERREIERTAVEEALARVLGPAGAEGLPPVVVAASADWHPGIVGLVAARLKERLRRPAFAFALAADGTATGSGRSVAGVDLGRAVRAAVEAGLATKGGGHAMAAGATVRAADIDAFAAFIAGRLADAVGDAAALDHLGIDAALTAGGAVPALVADLGRAGPFGAGQPEPVFAFAHHRLIDLREVGSGGHLRLRLKSGDGAVLTGVAFRAAGEPLGEALAGAVGGPVHVAATLAVDRWGGGERVEARVIDIATPG